MNARWTVSTAACAAVLLCGALLATAAEPNVGQNQPAMQGSAGIIQKTTVTGTTVLDPQKQEPGSNKHVALGPQTGSAAYVALAPARPIANPIVPCPPVPCAVPQPSAGSADSWAGWSDEMIDFSSE